MDGIGLISNYLNVGLSVGLSVCRSVCPHYSSFTIATAVLSIYFRLSSF